MSAVAAIFNVPGTQNEFNQWAFAHAGHHVDINRRIYELTGVKLDGFVLDPLNPSNVGVWLYQHQAMHQQMDAILGIAGFDLLDVDFTSKNQFPGWVWLNAQEHYQASVILGFG